MEQLSAAERRNLATTAAAARWAARSDAIAGNPLPVTHGNAARPLRIGEIEIPCYIVEGDIRVLSQRGLLSGVGLSQSGGSAGKHRMKRFIQRLGECGTDVGDLVDRIDKPIFFHQPTAPQQVAFGYEATCLADICNAVLDAHSRKPLGRQFEHVVAHCRVLSRAFSKVGIIALVDEATGFQYDRTSDALEELLRKFLSDELRRWVKTFPDEFYRELFRVYGYSYSDATSRRTAYIGKLTKDLIYERLAPEVLAQLEARNPRMPSGRRRYKHFQWFTDDFGVPRLREHLHAVITLLKASPTNGRKQFYAMAERALPKHEDALQLRLFDPPTEE